MTSSSLLLGLVITAILLASVPVSAVSEEYILEIFGNANEDDTIDQNDVDHTMNIVLGLDEQTQLADAKYDGNIDILDITQVELITLEQETELTVIDTADRVVTVDKPIERIVICSCGEQGEALRILNVMDKVVGVSSKVQEEPAKSFFPEFQQLPNVGSWDNYEAILSLDPDIVIMYDWTEWLYPDTEKNLPGVTLLRFNIYQSYQMFDEMKKLGYIFNRKDKAKEYEDFIEQYLSIVEQKVGTLSEDEKPRVYVETAEPWRTSNKEGAPASPIRMAGGRNIAEDEKGSPTGMITDIDPEWVLEQNPEIIIKLDLDFFGGYDEGDMTRLKDARKEVLNRETLKNLEAVRNEKVYSMSISPVYQPYFHTGVAYLAKWFHPELFEDLDPQAIHREYLEKYHGAPKEFYFAYPPLEG